MTTIQPPRDLARTTLGVLFIGALIASSLWVLRPFIPAIIWAAMLVIATWPVMLGLQRRLWGRRSLAVTTMTLILLLLFVVPLTLAISTIVAHSGVIVEQTKALAEYRPGPAPPWLAGLPLVGEHAVEFWDRMRSSDAATLLKQLTPYLADVAKWFVGHIGSVGMLVAQFLLTIGLSAVMYAGGEGAARSARRFGWRLAGDRGEQVVVLAGRAVRGVALGVGVTAIVQSVLGGLGLAIAGVPFAGLLTAVMFLLCIAQVGPLLVLLPATGWLFWSGATGWGAFLLVVSLVVGTLDNFLRPVLIRRGADLPLLLIFGGVIGGLIAFGLVGIFIGPVVLAVAYTLFRAWIAEGESDS